MFRKLVVISTVAFLFTLTVPNVSAQTNDTSTISATPLKKQKTVLKQQLKDTIQAKKLEVKQAIQAKREEYKIKLQTIKDERKKATVQRIDTKLSAVNEKHTNRFAEALERLQSILDKITDQDTTDPQKAINAAKTAVENQAVKAYVITIADEINLKQNVGATVSQLRQDLMVAHKTVMDAKQSVQSLKK
ncbi:MAG: hypothetical protein A3C22_01320 [Candidatus Levybacteria bacterium RIFCSPHIGHO2_02_FULL_37_10]|uniref:DUF5667 domain-containing protein n=1 Tax=candidate division WWE3 bacterium RIFCSPHIGHO2_01_FULL_35_17 TaxID=1802614 RepID=A0A1F4UPE3_UNCKA|nr:MAG: hypothetical protein A2713_01330 [candidate division WWE3 bacterium RIFCSPHIGHO2_01_FULL_35_17]OGH16596.1 MAG: hypothetical protein A3C22_01320 [Candidatus Levybacteria bacterium RIFCSPHIGHO2_02_FULL_37_10]OGH42254.1 MAG: hypothetical protein A3H79_01600 [Candidatus Levybacteria bacterium RIFCSPLOWO2_02_FULL_36_8b]